MMVYAITMVLGAVLAVCGWVMLCSHRTFRFQSRLVGRIEECDARRYLRPWSFDLDFARRLTFGDWREVYPRFLREKYKDEFV